MNPTTCRDQLGVPILVDDIVTIISYGTPVRVGDVGRRARVAFITRAGDLGLDQNSEHDPIARGRAVRPAHVAVVRRDGMPGYEANRHPGIPATGYYLAAGTRRAAEMRDRRHELLTAVPGSTVTSSWIDDILKVDPGAGPADRQKAALRAMRDLDGSGVLVVFAENEGTGHGGTHAEFGYMLARDNLTRTADTEPIRLVVVGQSDNVFHQLVRVEHFASWQDFLAHETADLCRYDQHADNGLTWIWPGIDGAVLLCLTHGFPAPSEAYADETTTARCHWAEGRIR